VRRAWSHGIIPLLQIAALGGILGVADRRGREHNRRMERGKGFFGRSWSEAEHRRVLARTYYDFEVEYRAQGWGDPAFVYDGEHDRSASPTDNSLSYAGTLPEGCLEKGRLEGL
jgi:hypothetical protein